jgi:hypothetical protein
MCHLSIILNFAFTRTRTQVTWAFTFSYFNIIIRITRILYPLCAYYGCTCIIIHLRVRLIGISKDIPDFPRYPKISIHQDMFWICSGYLLGIPLDIIWMFLDIIWDTFKISQAYPLISRMYPELSISLSRDIHLLIRRYPSTYLEISIYLSRDIHLPIQRYPAICPDGLLIRSRLVLLAAACSCSNIALTQATTGRCWQLAHRGQATVRQGR